MRRRLAGGRVLILGGSCDLALGLAEALIVEKVYPILTHRSVAAEARIHERLMPMGGAYEALCLDLGRKTTLTALDPVLDAGIDAMVDFAQGDLEGLVASVETADAASYLEAQIAHRAAVIQRVSRAMVSRRKGRMIHVSSTAAGRPHPGQGFYAAAKLAAEALYRNVGLELATRGVTTVTLRPGYVDAGRGRRYLEKNAGAALAKVPLGRALAVHEVVDTLLFLLSESAVGFNATVLTMDGGLAAGK